MARKIRIDLDADTLDTESAPITHRASATDVTTLAPGQPGFGTTIWIDENGSQAGGEVYAVAEINGVAASQLGWQHGHFFFL